MKDDAPRKMHDLSNLWSEMHNEKDDLVDRSEAYARWTLPYICMPDGGYEQEAEKGSVDNGAKYVNGLANKIVEVLFPTSRPFFKLSLTAEAQLRMAQEVGEASMPQVLENANTTTARIEKIAVKNLNLTEYRPRAIEAVKHLIITGNVVIRRDSEDNRIVYGVRNHCIRRDRNGNEIHVLLYDQKRLEEFEPETQDRIKQAGVSNATGASLTDFTTQSEGMTLITEYKKIGKRWRIRQEVAGLPIGEEHYQNELDYDLLCLTWNHASGEHYGRGLVEDNAVLFHKLDVTGAATTALMAVMCDIKFLVRAGSPLSQQVEQLHAANVGSYFVGNEGDITVPDIGKRGDLQVMINRMDTWDQQLAGAFLNANVRNAERVTAEEIRLIAKELESAYGGIYSKLAEAWQAREAEYVLAKTDLIKQLGQGMFEAFEVVIVSGADSLSREGVLDNLRQAVMDLQMLEAVPEDVRGTLNADRFAKFVFENHYLDPLQFVNTAEEMQARQQQEQQMQAQLMQQQAATNVQEHAGKSAIDRTQ